MGKCGVADFLFYLFHSVSIYKFEIILVKDAVDNLGKLVNRSIKPPSQLRQTQVRFKKGFSVLINAFSFSAVWRAFSAFNPVPAYLTFSGLFAISYSTAE